MARPTVHRTGSRRLLADKTGFDPRHRVSSVIFRVVPRPLWSSRLAGVHASRSLAKDHLFYDNYSPLRMSSSSNSLHASISDLLSVDNLRFDVRSAETISVHPPMLDRVVRDRGNLQPRASFGLHLFLPGGAQLPASSVSPDLSPDRGHVIRR